MKGRDFQCTYTCIYQNYNIQWFALLNILLIFFLKCFPHNAPTHEMDKDTLLVRCQMH